MQAAKVPAMLAPRSFRELMDPTSSNTRARPARLGRREWALLALGIGTWVALGLGGAWLYHQLTRPPASCGTTLEARSMQTRATFGGPRNALQLLTGTGRCP